MTLADDYNLRSRLTAKLNDIADAIDALRIPYGQLQEEAVISTTSTSFVQLSAGTISLAVESNQAVLLIGTVSVSNDTVGNDTRVRLMRDGSTALGSEIRKIARTANTGGRENFTSFVHVDVPGAGNFVYDLEFRAANGTAYSIYRRLVALVFRAG